MNIYDKLSEVEAKITAYHRTVKTGVDINPAGDIGGIRSRSAKAKERIFDRYSRDAATAVALYNERDRIKAKIAFIEEAPEREKRDIAKLLFWDNIKAGDTFQPGNYPIRIIRKNAWSITTEGGTRWSIVEVVGISRQRAEELREMLQQTH